MIEGLYRIHTSLHQLLLCPRLGDAFRLTSASILQEMAEIGG